MLNFLDVGVTGTGGKQDGGALTRPLQTKSVVAAVSLVQVRENK